MLVEGFGSSFLTYGLGGFGNSSFFCSNCLNLSV
jgi:hypothetical protein